MILLLGNNHLFGFLYYNGGMPYSVVAICSQPIWEELMNFSTEGITLGISHSVELAKGRKGFVANGNRFDASHVLPPVISGYAK